MLLGLYYFIVKKYFLPYSRILTQINPYQNNQLYNPSQAPLFIQAIESYYLHKGFVDSKFLYLFQGGR